MKKILMGSILYLFGLKAYSQNINYFDQLNQLLLSNPTEYKYGHVLNPNDVSHDRFLGFSVALLPPALHNKYFSPVKVLFTQTGTFEIIARLSHEAEPKRKLDFYSTWNEPFDYRKDLSVAKDMENDFIYVFTSHNWKLIKTIKEKLVHRLVFERENLTFTVSFEILGDVQDYPFWATLHGFNISYPRGHTPRLECYIHFILENK